MKKYMLLDYMLGDYKFFDIKKNLFIFGIVQSPSIVADHFRSMSM